MIRQSLWAAVLFSVGLAAAVGHAEETLEEAARRLVAQLDAADPKQRDAAEKEILQVGHGLLRFFPHGDDKNLTAEQRFRLERVVPDLIAMRAKASGDASVVRIDAAGVTVGDLVQAIRDQSGNVVVLDEAVAADVGATKLDLDAGAHRFWELLDAVGRQGELAWQFRRSDRAIVLVPGDVGNGPVHREGAFRFGVERVLLSEDFRPNRPARSCVLDVAMHVEPRLRPVQMQLVGSTISATDDQGRVLAHLGPSVAYIGFEEGAIETRFGLRLECPERSAKALREVVGELDVLIPSHEELFVFDRTTGFEDVEVTRRGMRVMLESFEEEDEGIWVARVLVAREGAGNELDSFQRGAMRNEVDLESPEGERVPQDGGMNSQDLGGGKTQLEYLFVDVPGRLEDYRLRIRVPGGFARVRVPFSFSDVTLP